MADEPKSLNFQVREYSGTEVYKFNPADHEEHLDRSKLKPLTREEDVAEGDRLLVPGLSGGYYLMTVEKDEDGSLVAMADKLMAVLEFAADDRKAWTCGGLINLRGVARLSKETQ